MFVFTCLGLLHRHLFLLVIHFSFRSLRLQIYAYSLHTAKDFADFWHICVKPEAGFLQPLMVRNTNRQEADIPEWGVSASCLKVASCRWQGRAD